MLWGCSSKKVQYKGDFENRKYTIYNVTQKNIFAKHYFQQLNIKGLPSLKINYTTTNMGIPYSFDIYRQATHVVLDSTSFPYSDKYQEGAGNYVTLYIDPKKFSKEQYGILSSFFTKEWPGIKNVVPLEQGYRKLNIVALVYGKDAQFTHSFKYNGKAIEIWTDGSIYLNNDNRSIQSTNLSSMVKMPGYQISLRQPHHPFTMESLDDYKDDSGKTIKDHFHIVQE